MGSLYSKNVFQICRRIKKSNTMSAEQPMNVPDTLEFLRFMNELKVNFYSASLVALNLIFFCSLNFYPTPLTHAVIYSSSASQATRLGVEKHQ
jgi:hypothetical protein